MSEDDRTPGGHPVVVLSHDYWHRRFNADPSVVGRLMSIDARQSTIIGVARKGFFGIEPGKFTDVWRTAAMYEPKALSSSGWAWFRILGRLAPGVTREQLQARLQPVFHDFQQERVKWVPTMPASIRQQFLEASIRVLPSDTGASAFRRIFARPLWIVLGVAAGILLIACANVASLLLARSNARSAEIAMRVSLGAGRGRLIRQLLTESLLFSLLAGVVGWLMATLAAPTLVTALSKNSDPVRFVLAMDSRVLLFCLAVSTIAALTFGLVPAWRASGAQPIHAMRGASGQAGKLRLGRFFVAVQVAFALGLVMVGAAFLFSLRNLIEQNTGFDPRGVTVFHIVNKTGTKPKEAQGQLIYELRARLAEQQGVQGVAAAPWAIFEGAGWSEQILVPGKPVSEREEIFYPVSTRYFATLRTPLLSGRDFEPLDANASGATPTIVNRALVERYFDGQNPLGKEFQHPSGKVRNVVIGVAANAHYGDLRKGAEPIAYVPLDGGAAFSLYIRSELSTGSLARLVEREAQALGSGTRVRQITTLETLVGDTILRERLLAGIGGAFAFLGLVLAAIGLFGLLNYSVERRTKELGIRAALGARRGQIVSLVLKETGALVTGGLIAGLAGSFAVMTLFESLLFGVRSTEPLVIVTAAAIFSVTALVAGGLPARRAASVDPMVALRCE